MFHIPMLLILLHPFCRRLGHGARIPASVGHDVSAASLARCAPRKVSTLVGSPAISNPPRFLKQFDEYGLKGKIAVLGNATTQASTCRTDGRHHGPAPAAWPRRRGHRIEEYFAAPAHGSF